MFKALLVSHQQPFVRQRQTADIVTESPDVSVIDRRITGNIDQILSESETLGY